MAKEDSKKLLVAYVPFKTFLTALDILGNGVPTAIDRSVWPSFSNATISQLLIAFKFLGLITGEGVPTIDLEKLATDREHRKPILRRILEHSYPNLIKGNLAKMTRGTFQKAMHEYGVEGETFKKASSFFLQAARYAELPMSEYIMKQTRSVSPRKRRTPVAGLRKVRDANGKSPFANSNAPVGPTKTIMLRKGIPLSLMAGADTFEMDAPDRSFVNRLLEEMELYEREIKGFVNEEG